MKTANTDVDGWKYDCLNWAKANVPFEIHGIETIRHLAFCAELCADYNYRLSRRKSIATFSPLKPN